MTEKEAALDYVIFVVYGDAAPQGSKSFKGFSGGKAIMTESSKKVRPWRQEVSATAMQHRRDPLWDEAVILKLSIYTPKPRSARKKDARKVTTPDSSKMLRGIEDALEGIIYRNDARIDYHIVRKKFGSPARVVIEMWHVPKTFPPPDDPHDTFVSARPTSTPLP